MEYISFNSNKFPFREIDFSFGKRLIATHELNECLMNFDGTYSSYEAEKLDEEIFYFVDNDIINFSDSFILKTVLTEI